MFLSAYEQSSYRVTVPCVMVYLSRSAEVMVFKVSPFSLTFVSSITNDY